MEYLHELIALSVDGLILGLCLKEYFSYKNTLDVLKVCNLQYLYFNIISSVQIKVIFFIICVRLPNNIPLMKI